MKHSVTLVASLFAGLLFTLGGCGQATDAPAAPETATAHHEHHGSTAGGAGDSQAPPTQPEGHRRMVALLAELDVAAQQENPHLGAGLATRVRADLAGLPPAETLPKRWYLRVLLGSQELRLGNVERAVELYEEAYRLLGESRDPVPVENYVRNVYEIAVAYLRLGETTNCVMRHTSESCLLPIGPGGVHVDQEGSRNAIRYFTALLEHVPPDSRDYLRARWLLNIAYMTLGRYPDGVPPAYLVPPQVFESDEPFPRFAEIAPQLGLADFDLAGGAAGDDFDGDGDLDLLVSSSDTHGPLRLYRNHGDGTFTERARAAGLAGIHGGLNLNQADYDNDGDIDALVLRGAWWRQNGRHPSSLLRNNGDGTFTDVTFEAGLGEPFAPTQTAAWSDYDLDGDLDLFKGSESGKALRTDSGTDGDDMRAPCRLFRNNGDGSFTDVAAAAGVENMGYTKGVVWGDYDRDRYPDLYVSNGGNENRLYHNNGDGSFTDVARQLGVTHPIASFPVWFWDVNNDGWLDLYVAAYGGPQLRPDVASVAAGYLGLPDPGGELAKLYLADGRGGFKDVAAEWNLDRPTLPMGSNYGDLDNDGFLDFYLGTGYPFYDGLIPNVMYHNRRGKGFADVTKAGGFGHLQKGHGISFADFDDDGDQDIFEQMGGAWPGDGYGDIFFENPGFGQHWIKISLTGVRSNRLGVGSRIRLDVVEDSERRTIYHHVSSGGSFGANPLGRSEIGVGRAQRIEAVEVFWPASDTTQRFLDVAVDQWIEIREGQATYQTRPLHPVQLGRAPQPPVSSP